jgi:hypothetical protein
MLSRIPRKAFRITSQRHLKAYLFYFQVTAKKRGQGHSVSKIIPVSDATTFSAGIRSSSAGIAQTSRGVTMNRCLLRFASAILLAFYALGGIALAQQPDGPQISPPAAAARPPQPGQARNSGPAERISVPAGTRFAVVLENGISTRGAKPGDSLYFRTAFPITQNNRIVVPVGSYLRGEIVESKRPGRIKGRGEFRMRLNTLILPNGYTVDLNAAPRSADSGGHETMDSEGKMTGGGGKGKDVGTVATTTATGAGIGAIAGGAKGAGIGAGIGGLAGLGAILLTRGPEAELPRGSTLDVVLEHELALDGSQIQYSNVGQASPITPPPARAQ